VELSNTYCLLRSTCHLQSQRAIRALGHVKTKIKIDNIGFRAARGTGNFTIGPSPPPDDTAERNVPTWPNWLPLSQPFGFAGRMWLQTAQQPASITVFLFSAPAWPSLLRIDQWPVRKPLRTDEAITAVRHQHRTEMRDQWP
jgi:hypothetical protein